MKQFENRLIFGKLWSRVWCLVFDSQCSSRRRADEGKCLFTGLLTVLASIREVGSAASVLVTAMNDEQSPAAAAGATLRARRRLVCLLSHAVRPSDRVAVQQ